MHLSVVLPTHNPNPGRLARTLAGLAAQTLPAAEWEALLVDNASSPALTAATIATLGALGNLRLIAEPELGLTAARRSGFRAARGELIVLVDDDNVLAPDYLARAIAIFDAHPRLGAIGGRSLPEFEQTPHPWVREFDHLLACRDLGPEPRIATAQPSPPGQPRHYPAAAPIGAGMALRRQAAASWLDSTTDPTLTDRRGTELTSGGDNDIVLTVARTWDVGYFPALVLTHLIPSSRTTRTYLAKLNHGIARSWIHVLAKHRACPWAPVAGWTVPLRQAKAWFTYRAWSGPAAHVRWQGACGHFKGRASLAAERQGANKR